MLGLMKTIWAAWKAFTHGLVKVQSQVLMALVYFLALGPVSLFIKLSPRRRLDRAPADPEAATYGLLVVPVSADVRQAQRPW